ILLSFYIFFFSSRRRHTRWPRDWSSDVCSSDLKGEWPYRFSFFVVSRDPRGRGATVGRQAVLPAPTGPRASRSNLVSATRPGAGDRKSTRLNSSHVAISYAVFCLKKKRKIKHQQ